MVDVCHHSSLRGTSCLRPSWILVALFGWTMVAEGAKEGLRSSIQVAQQQQLRHVLVDQYQTLVGYEPMSLITDEAWIDLDVKVLSERLDTKKLKDALPVYVHGGHSGSYADLHIKTKESVSLQWQQEVIGTASDGSQVVGNVGKTMTTTSSATTTSMLRVFYTISPDQDNNAACQVGGLWNISEAVVAGCFNATGTLSFLNHKTPFAQYTYNPVLNNRNSRTLQTLSLSAGSLYLNCKTGGCPYEEFQKYTAYYNSTNYGDEWIMSAFNGTLTTFRNGNANFFNYTHGARGDAIVVGAVMMNIWMTIVGEMEAAIDTCSEPLRSIARWDAAVAYYAGSTQKQDDPTTGYLGYSIANSLCEDFKTCGAKGSDVSGTAYVNYEIIKQFKIGQNAITKHQCDLVRQTKNRIVRLMTVALVQGTLLAAYQRDKQATVTRDLERAEAQGAAFAAAVLPLVYNCSQKDAVVIYSNMGLGQSSKPTFENVKAAFEDNYDCMGITCDEVGGYYLQIGEYGVNAAPCGGGLPKQKKVGISLGTIACFLFAVLVLAVGIKYWRRRKRVVVKEEPFAGSTVDMPVDLREAPAVT